ncbi:MAG: autotransporter assembly complex protein TamA [Gammaproteobacteria bacterium]
MVFRACLAVLCLCWIPMAVAVQVEVRVTGVEGEALSNVRAYLAIERETKNPDVLESRVRELNARAPREIKRALEPFGYYKATVRASLTAEGDKLVADYRIDPGPAVRIAAMHVDIAGPGARNPEMKDVVKKLPLHRGDVLRHADYDQAKQLLQRQARGLGYLDADLDRHQVRVQLQPYQATVTLRLNTGPRYTFGPVTFKQTTYTVREKLLYRYVPFKQGDDFSTAKLLQLYSALSDSGYFSQVDVEPHRREARGTAVPVVVTLSPRRRQRYKIGVGYGTDTGARLTFQFWRLLNRRGHVGTADVRLSQYLNSATVGYTIPLQHPTTEQLTFEAGLKNEDTKSRISRIWQIGASRTGTRGSWREVMGLHYEVERYELATGGSSSKLLYPSVTWTRMRADDPIYPTRGNRLQLDLKGSSAAMLSDVSFVQAHAAGKWVRSFGTGNQVIARAELGATWTSSFDKLPASKRFFAGGDQSVRGYGYEQLGPTDATGAVVGGRYLAVGSLEYDRHLFGKWSGALFYDVGNAFNNANVHFARGAGFGVRWRSPLGPVRVDFAWALSQPGTPFRLHVTVGPDL